MVKASYVKITHFQTGHLLRDGGSIIYDENEDLQRNVFPSARVWLLQRAIALYR